MIQISAFIHSPLSGENEFIVIVNYRGVPSTIGARGKYSCFAPSSMRTKNIVTTLAL